MLDILVYFGDTLVLGLSLLMLYLSYRLLREFGKFSHHDKNKINTQIISIIGLSALGVASLLFGLYVCFPNASQIMTGVKGSAHGWAAGIMCLSLSFFLFVASASQLYIIIKSKFS